MRHFHDLKIKTEYFKEVKAGKKTFEIRKNDRGFKVNDLVTLHEVDESGLFTGETLSFKITYITDFEQKPGYVVFSIEPEK